MNAIKAARYMAEYWKYYAEKKGIKALLALNKALDILGLKDKPKESPAHVAEEPAAYVVSEQRNGHLYAFDATRTKTQRQRDNDAAISLIRKVDSGEIGADSLTSADKALLAKYSGNGGGIKGADGKVGSAHEYYTPKDVAVEMWAALEGMGFSGGRVLDPCSGSGVFGATSPANALVDNVELDYTSAKVNELVNGKAGYTVANMPFEAYAARTDDNVFDAVCTNVPFAPKANRAFKNDDKKYQNATLHGYFILRALDKLKYGGLAAFIVPTAVLEGKGKDAKLRLATAFKAEFLGAYRLPNKVFELGATGADVATDIIFFRKYSKEATERIEELQTSNPAILTEANVLRDDFLKGRWFKLAEHKKFIFGEERQVEDQRWGGIVTKVINEQSISNIAKGIKPFGASAINWELLEAAESSPIVYTDGDIVNQNGQTFEYRDGEFVPVVVSSNEAESEANDVVDKLETPYRAFMNGITYDRTAAALAYLKETDNMFGIPQWANDAVASVAGVPENKQAKQWRLILTALSVKTLLEENSGEPFDYLDASPELSEAMKERAAADKSLSADLRNVIAAMKAHYSKKDGYSLVWQGKNQAVEKEFTTEQRVEALKYKTNSLVMGLEEMKEIDPSFDVLTNDDYVCSADGNIIMRADDYFTGNVAAVMRDLDARIANAANDDIRAKLSRMKATAMERVTVRDVSKLQFDLRSPFITLQEKAFWIENMTLQPKPSVTIIDGELKIEHNGGNDKNEITSKHKLLNRIGMYIRNGQLSLGGDSIKLYKADGKQMNDQEKGVFGREFLFELNTRFDIWVRSNQAIQDRLEKAANDPESLYFDRIEDNAPLSIEGMNNDDWKLHGYQASWVRQQAREFGGINAYGVGLGKAQPLTAKVLTPEGWKLMGDLKVGDLVVAHDGTFTPITAIYPQGKKEIFEVVFSDGAKTECCDEHLWLTQTKTDRSRYQYQKSVGHTVPKFGGTVKQLSEIRQTLIKGKRTKNHKIPMVGMIDLPARELPIHPYLFGVVLGDGCLSDDGAVVTTPEAYIVNRMNQIVFDEYQGDVTVNAMKCKGRCASYRLSKRQGIKQNPLLTRLRDYGLMGVVSDEKFIPKEYLTASYEQRLDLLHGLMDTDGYVSKDGYTVQFYSTSDNLADSVIELVQSFGGNALKKVKKANYKKNGIVVDCKDCWVVTIRMPAEISPFSLPRKADRVKPKSKYQPYRYIVAVNSVGEKEAQCIQIEHDDHLYITDDYIVTHNTFSALSAVQYAHSVGTKKKTLFVLPKNVFSNWHKEINGNENRAGCYTRETASRCLWVGVDFDKGFNYKSSNNARDLNRILENQHDKVFMTYETFKSIPLSEETVEQYLAYLRKSDKAFAENELKAMDEKSEARLADLVALFTTRDKNEASPKFEMMGFDSIVIDEAHAMKNGKQVFEFGANTRGLGNISSPSALALDTLAKTWYIRGKNDTRNDGVLALTATPITNSPLEIYTMLTLAKGEDFVKSQVLGVDGADGFMKAVCRIENVEDVNIEGKYVGTDMLVGLNNVELLRGVLRGAAEIKNAKDVALAAFVPDGVEEKVSIQCPDDLKAQLDLQIKDYNFARQFVKENFPITYGEEEINSYERAVEISVAISQRYGQPIQQVGQPFSLIHKMNVMLTDPELYDGGTFYKFDDDARANVEKAVEDFNKKAYKEKVTRLSKYTDRANVVKELIKKDEDGNIRNIEYTVKITAEIDDVENRVVIDSTDFGTIAKFEDLLDKHQADVDVNGTVKFAALIANMKNENAHIRADAKQAAKGYAKQIVFNEHLGSHFKMRRLIAKGVGIPASKIQFISGAAETADAKKYDILETQNGFNAAGEENKYCVIIANEKAEVGINLQIGCQAIHHVNIRWTPDSITQRNGRGQRQGNITGKVNIYYYEADGTFDMYRRSLVNSKASWIDSLMSGDASSVDMSNMTNEQLAQVIDTMSNGGDLESLMKAKDEAEKAARIKQHKARQVLAIKNIKGAMRWLDRNQSAAGYLENEGDKLIEQLKRFITQGKKVLKCFETGASPKSFGNNLNNLKGLAGLVNESIGRLKGAFSDKASHFDFIDVESKYSEYLAIYSDGKEAEGKIAVRNAIDEWVKTASSYFDVMDTVLGRQMKVEGLSLAEKSFAAERKMYEDQVNGARKQLEAMAANDKDGYGYGQKAIETAINDEMFDVDGDMMVVGMPVIVDNSKMGFITLIQSIGWGSDKGKHTVRVMQSDLQDDGKYKLNSVTYTAENTKNIRYLNSPDAEDAVLEDLAKAVIDMGEDHYLAEQVLNKFPRVREFFPDSYQSPIYFDLSQNTLKSPLFPLVISDASGIEVLERMKAKQDELIGEVTYINSSTLQFERGEEYIGNNSFGREALLNILIENGMELPNGIPSGLLDSAFHQYGLSTRLHVGNIFDAYMKNASDFNDDHVYQSAKELYEQKMKERVLLSDGKSKIVGLNEKQAAVMGLLMAIAEVVNNIGVKDANFNPNLKAVGMDTSNVYLETLGGSRYMVESVSGMVSRLKERWSEETKVKVGGYVNLVGNTYQLNQKVGIKQVCIDKGFEYGFSGDGRKIGGKIDYDKIRGVEFAPKSWVIETAAWEYIKSIASPELLEGVQAIEL